MEDIFPYVVIHENGEVDKYTIIDGEGNFNLTPIRVTRTKNNQLLFHAYYKNKYSKKYKKYKRKTFDLYKVYKSLYGKDLHLHL